MKERLHKILAQQTSLSRRSAEEAIKKGEVTLNGKVVNEMGVLADPMKDHIKWKGKRIQVSSQKLYVIYHKPKGKLVTKKDEHGRDTIWSDLKKFKDNLNAVGRLDYDSEGLLILTNDGDLINKLTHPKFHIPKSYNVKVRGVVHRDSVAKIREGITYKGVAYQPAKIRLKSITEKHQWLDITIEEGKNRQIRNMCEAIGHPVLKLKRIAVGPIRLGKLEPGKWKFMTRLEVRNLIKSTR